MISSRWWIKNDDLEMGMTLRNSTFQKYNLLFVKTSSWIALRLTFYQFLSIKHKKLNFGKIFAIIG